MVDPGTQHKRPAWVMVVAVIAAVGIILVVGMALAGGDHGPGRHLPEGREDASTEHTPPSGGHD